MAKTMKKAKRPAKAARKPGPAMKAKPARKAAPVKAKAAKKAPPRAAAKPKAAAGPKWIAPNMSTVSPYLAVRDVAAALRWYQKVLGFKLRNSMPGPGGAIMHAELEHHGGVIMLGPENPERGSKGPAMLGGSPVTLYVYVSDVDAVCAAAAANGAHVTMPVADQFWGDRAGTFTDPEGHSWMLATFKKVVTPAEMASAMQQMAGGGGQPS